MITANNDTTTTAKDPNKNPMTNTFSLNSRLNFI